MLLTLIEKMDLQVLRLLFLTPSVGYERASFGWYGLQGWPWPSKDGHPVVIGIIMSSCMGIHHGDWCHETTAYLTMSVCNINESCNCQHVGDAMIVSANEALGWRCSKLSSKSIRGSQSDSGQNAIVCARVEGQGVGAGAISTPSLCQ